MSGLRTGLFAAAAACIAGAAWAQAAPMAALTTGQVKGVQQGGLSVFMGIPYAAPPVGDLRWRPPAPAANWTGVRDATAFGPTCPQKPSPRFRTGMSEDCLTLNIWTPAKVGENTPVYVFFYGGGGFGGTSAGSDGAALAKKGVVVVTLNYRVGIMDAYVHPDLVQEQGGSAGNYGLQDCIAALRWVKANIKAFGGDPSKVTIGGESTGARLVASILASPTAKGLVSGAIAESGEGWGLYDHIVPLQEAEILGVTMAAEMGAPSIAQMRALPADAVVASGVSYVVATRVGVLDGRVLTSDPHYSIPNPAFADTPIMSGFAYDEEGGFDPKFNAWTVDDYVARLNLRYLSLAGEAAKIYPVKTDADALVQTRIMARDRDRIALYEWGKRRAQISKQPIYMFLFEHPVDARHGTVHAREGVFAFGAATATPEDAKVSDQLVARWAAFIRTGSPNGPGMPQWDAFKTAAPKVMHIGDADALEPLLPAEKLKLSDAWGKMGGSPENGRGAFEPVPK